MSIVDIACKRSLIITVFNATVLTAARRALAPMPNAEKTTITGSSDALKMDFFWTWAVKYHQPLQELYNIPLGSSHPTLRIPRNPSSLVNIDTFAEATLDKFSYSPTGHVPVTAKATPEPVTHFRTAPPRIQKTASSLTVVL